MTDSVIPLRALEHYSYCPRQAALIHVDGVWLDNEHTIEGVRGHRRVDEAPSRLERGRRVLRSIPLWSEEHGLTGRADAVELFPDGHVEPVEYKHGRRHGAAARIQLCAQALCLEEMLGVEVGIGHVWHAALRRRDRVDIDDGLRARTIETIDAVRRLFESVRLPAAVDDERCRECQLLGHCLPSVVAHPTRVVSYLDREVFGCA